MNEVADAIELARYEVAQVSYDILPDLLTIYAPPDEDTRDNPGKYRATTRRQQPKYHAPMKPLTLTSGQRVGR